MTVQTMNPVRLSLENEQRTDDQLIGLFCEDCELRRMAPTTIRSIITTFVRDLYGRPVKCTALAELQGIVIRPRELKPSSIESTSRYLSS